jgi:hypothetical protein
VNRANYAGGAELLHANLGRPWGLVGGLESTCCLTSSKTCRQRFKHVSRAVKRRAHMSTSLIAPFVNVKRPENPKGEPVSKL